MVSFSSGRLSAISQFPFLLPQPLCVERIAAYQMLAQNARRPLAELHATLGFDPIADGNDDVRVVEAHPASDPSPCFLLNHRGFLGSSLPLQIVFFVDVPYVKPNGIRVFAKQIGHLPLIEPHCFASHMDFEARPSILGIIEDNIRQSTFRPKSGNCKGGG